MLIIAAQLLLSLQSLAENDPRRFFPEVSIAMTPAPASAAFVSDDPAVDKDLEMRVRLFLETLRLAVPQRVRVRVRNGEVTVAGAVRTYYERQLVVACIKRVAGVRQVTDIMVVRDDSPRPGVQLFAFNEVLR